MSSKGTALGLTLVITLSPIFNVVPVQAQQRLTTAAQQKNVIGAIALDPDDIGGVVRSSKGPEAGVWVIAETKDLATKFARIVVTDDQGRYVKGRALWTTYASIAPWTYEGGKGTTSKVVKLQLRPDALAK